MRKLAAALEVLRPCPRTLLRGLVPLLLTVTVVHVIAIGALPDPEVWGDEQHYLALAENDALVGTTSLVPGRLRFDHRPELVARVFSKLVAAGDPARTVRRASVLNLALLAAMLALIHAQARLLGLSTPTALVVTALVGGFPWLAFHVHALWPEILHGLFLALALASLLAYLRVWLGMALIPSGLALGAALLTKGSLAPLLPLILAVIVWATWRRCRTLGIGPLLPSALAVVVLVTGIAVMVVPQLNANARAGHGWRLAANRWWNLELGVTVDGRLTREQKRAARQAELAPGLERWLPWVIKSRRYYEAADTPKERERLARRRVEAYVVDHGLFPIALAQVGRLARLVATGEPSFEQSLSYRRRWGEDPPLWLLYLRVPGRLLWYAVWILGLAGVALVRWRSPGWLLITVFVLGYLAAALAVPFKIRFLLPLFPVLCLGAGAALEHGADLIRRRQGSRASENSAV